MISCRRCERMVFASAPMLKALHRRHRWEALCLSCGNVVGARWEYRPTHKLLAEPDVVALGLAGHALVCQILGCRLIKASLTGKRERGVLGDATHTPGRYASPTDVVGFLALPTTYRLAVGYAHDKMGQHDAEDWLQSRTAAGDSSRRWSKALTGSAAKLLRKNWAVVEAMAEMLLQGKTLCGDDLDCLLLKHGAPKPETMPRPQPELPLDVATPVPAKRTFRRLRQGTATAQACWTHFDGNAPECRALRCGLSGVLSRRSLQVSLKPRAHWPSADWGWKFRSPVDYADLDTVIATARFIQHPNTIRTDDFGYNFVSALRKASRFSLEEFEAVRVMMELA